MGVLDGTGPSAKVIGIAWLASSIPRRKGRAQLGRRDEPQAFTATGHVGIVSGVPVGPGEIPNTEGRRTMKALALSVGVVLMAGVVAVADDHPMVGVANDKGGGQDPFANRSFADVVTSVSEAPTGRFMVGGRNEKDPRSQERLLEQRLEAIEKKLDRVLKELKDLKGQTKPTR